MKTPLAFLFILAATIAPSFASSIPAPYEIGIWQGFRPAAISYTFDDNCTNQYAIAVPMFNARGFKMTLFTITSLVFDWTQVKNAAASGHEIASHTVTHPNLSTLSDAQQTNELKNSLDAINANVSGQKCRTLAYPFCVGGNAAITSQYYIAARSCSGQLVSSTPANFKDISSLTCGNLGAVQTAQDFNTKADSAATAKAWCVYLIHGIDNDRGYSPLPSATLQASLDYLSANTNKFWVDTFGNVVRYILERNAVSVVQTSNANDSITLQVTDNLDDSIYNQPITLRRPLPANWPSAMVSQGNNPVVTRLVSIASTNYVMFDVVPDGGNVVLSKALASPTVSNPALTTLSNLNFRLDGQAGSSYVIYASSNLLSWSSVQTSTLTGTYTNFTFAIREPAQFYRTQWLP